MEILTSNFPPLKYDYKTFSDSFSKLIVGSDYLQIASGYISAESITEIKRIIESNNGPKLDLLIGMHYFDGITRTQYESALYLNEFLESKNMGSVSIAKTYKFHGKVYSFSKNGKPIAGVIGSSNLNNILDTHRSYEVDVLFNDEPTSTEIYQMISKVRDKIAYPFKDWRPEIFIENNPLLEGHESVKKVEDYEYQDIRAKATGVSFEIPLKATNKHSKSNLNVYFGQGRKNSSTGFVKPRHWYEVELIVPKELTSDSNYPKAGYPETESTITVVTDDCWSFECKISGDYSKNFRSNKDLKILGKWIKGRLENNEALKVGEHVTEEVLKKYGRSNLKLTATNNPKVWILDFSV